MLVAVVCHFIVTNRRTLYKLFPENFVQKWKLWEIRGLVLFSFALQLVLAFLGNRRKYKNKLWLTVILWVAYQLADFVTNFSLNVLINGIFVPNDLNPDYEIMGLWAPLFVLHFCSTETLTAYSLQDNELWKRNSFALSGSFSMAIYVMYLSSNGDKWKGYRHMLLSIGILVCGLVKLFERIWVQYMASRDGFRDSLLPPPDPGPTYYKIMDHYSAKKAEGFKIEDIQQIELPIMSFDWLPHAEEHLTEEKIIYHAYSFFKNFKRLFADLILSVQDYKASRSFFLSHSCDVAFKVVEVELGFVYDIFYTKAAVLWSSSKSGSYLRLISVFLACSVFCAFLILHWHDFSKLDVQITCALLAGFLFYEIYGIILFKSSDWSIMFLQDSNYGSYWSTLEGSDGCWISYLSVLRNNDTWALKPYKCLKRCLIRCMDKVSLLFLGRANYLSFLRKPRLIPSEKRWSGLMAQYKLLDFCLKEKSPTLHGIKQYLPRKQYDTCVFQELKEAIYQHLVKRSLSENDIGECAPLCAFNGKQVHDNMKRNGELEWSIGEFDKLILLWHVATDLCSQDMSENSSSNLSEDILRKISISLSDYMLYILVNHPSMLPNGIGQIRFQDTCAEMVEFMQEWKYIKDLKQACSQLMMISTEVLPSTVKGDRSKSVLFDACRLAKSLEILEEEKKENDKGFPKKKKNDEGKWDILSRVWMGILFFAASHCPSQVHAERLASGGEFLTHVWLLMAHLGISEQFQISEGHGRVKLLFT